MSPVKVGNIRPLPKPYQGLSDKRIGQFRIRQNSTGQIVIVKGCTLAQAILYLGWDPNAVSWVHQGYPRTKDPVYLSTEGWRAIEPPFHPIHQPGG